MKNNSPHSLDSNNVERPADIEELLDMARRIFSDTAFSEVEDEMRQTLTRLLADNSKLPPVDLLREKEP